MKSSWIFLVPVFVLLFFSCKKDSPMIEQPDDGSSNSLGISDLELEAVNLINEFRAEGAICGTDEFSPAGPVFWNDILDQASEMHANDMASNGFVSHTGSDGSVHTERLATVSYSYLAAGENVAKGPATVASVIEEFKNSPNHCRVMMNPDYTQVGIGKVGTYWVFNFALPRKF